MMRLRFFPHIGHTFNLSLFLMKHVSQTLTWGQGPNVKTGQIFWHIMQSPGVVCGSSPDLLGVIKQSTMKSVIWLLSGSGAISCALSPSLLSNWWSQPLLIRNWTISSWLFLAAWWRGVNPSASLALISAPALRSCSTASIRPYAEARWSGVLSCQFLALTSAPAWMICSTISGDDLSAASWRGVRWSRHLTKTLAPLARRNLTDSSEFSSTA